MGLPIIIIVCEENPVHISIVHVGPLLRFLWPWAISKTRGHMFMEQNQYRKRIDR